MPNSRSRGAASEQPPHPQQLAAALDDLVPEGAPPLVFVVTHPGQGSEPIAGPPVEELPGWIAPANAYALAVISTGRTHPVGRADPLPSRAMRVVLVVDEHSRTGGRFRSGEEVIDDAPSGGRLPDTLRRCLRLPTPPPPATCERLLAALWLLALLETTGQPLDWAAALAHHPAAKAADAGDVAGSEAAARAAALVWSWEELRALAARGRLRLGVAPEVAAWMDAGMFARWVEGDLPSPEDLLPAARRRLTTEAATALDAWVDGLGRSPRWDAAPAAAAP